MAVAWVLRDKRVTSALIGASKVEQIDEAVKAAAKTEFSSAELSDIDRHAKDSGVNIWRMSSSA
jgi:L-glyceraldehyde 3-phosphate reductase